ncbi:hypothetical protein [Tepidibacter hydrothermalis]|uniref:Uncharacterized protein n=1 Tax=Tepidibacter hydrothermalis TaxID=3036126 RepID=A0ABY8EJ34_9FIRM|nr:hypothetical protein [Tepidibacter hydrothermalis]WFD11742.1 hypothetical protein P4S50_06605 [Tepidibacter hydrothermalis]
MYYNHTSGYIYFTIVIISIIIIGHTIIWSIKNKKPVSTTLMLICTCISGIATILYRLVDDYFIDFEIYKDLLLLIISIMLGLTMFFTFFGIFKYGDEKVKKLGKIVLIGFIIIGMTLFWILEC